jgi:hypothetical protein
MLRYAITNDRSTRAGFFKLGVCLVVVLISPVLVREATGG